MELKENYIYTIKEQYFKDFPDPNLKSNKSEQRPHYYAFKDKEENSIIWMIPLSSKIKKYERIIEKRKSQKKPCDIVHVCKIGAKKQAFVIQDMFPITKNYILDEYKINNIPYKLVSKKDINIIDKKAHKIKLLINKGIKVVPGQADVKSIEKKLLEKIKENEIKKKAFIKRQFNQER